MFKEFTTDIPLIQKPPALNLEDQLYRVVKELILDGRLPADSRIVESDLARKLEVSRTPLRAALRRLEQNGFVTRKEQGKLFVGQLSSEDLANLYAIRSALEGLATRLASSRLDTNQLEALEKIVNEMQAAVDSGNASALPAIGDQFHSIIIQNCGNPRLIEMLSQIHAHVERYRAASVTIPGRASESVQDHLCVLEALRSQKSEQAGTLMSQHIDKSRRRLADELESHRPSWARAR